MEGPPPQYTVKTLDEYLEHLSKGVFQAGISWRVVDAKWPSITKAFRGFDVERVARMTDRDVDALVKDERVIRSRPKIAAVVHNANELLALERAGGFKKHLKSFSEYEDLAKDLKKRFKFVGDSGVYHFLDGEAPGSRVARMVARPWHGLGSEGKSGWSRKDGAKQAAGRESTLHGSRGALRPQAASPRRTEAA